MNTNYDNRIRAAAWASTLLHLVLLTLGWWYRPAFMFGPSPQSIGPITVTLEPAPRPDASEQRQLIDVAQPATDAVKPTDLMATQNSNAQDTAPAPGEKPGPRVDVESTIDALGGRPGAAPSAAAPEEAATSVKPPAEEPKEAAAEKTDAPQATDAPAAIQMARASPSAEEIVEAAAKAAKDAAAAVATQEIKPTGSGQRENDATRGQKDRAIEHEGVQGFEAMQDKIAPYLKKVEAEVEKRWNEVLLTKYAGAKPTEAQINCEISADGRIVSVKITGTPDDRAYAALCKEAIEKAGPFGAFPFEVPDIYKNRNLEIRWSFHFL